MQMMQHSSRYWIVMGEEGVVLAEFILDPYCQMNEIILRTPDPLLHRRIRELALSHALQYQRNRSVELPGASRLDSDLTQHDSALLMSFDAIPAELSGYDDAQLDQDLSRFPVNITTAAFKSWMDVLQEAVSHVLTKHGVIVQCYTCPADYPDTAILAAFKIESDHVFRVWNRLGNSASNTSALNIIPSYHPSLQGSRSAGMINGATDALIAQSTFGISKIASPSGARTGQSGFGSWEYINHPFYAEGKNLGMQISKIQILSQEGYDLLVSLLSGALNLDKLYLEVISGFNSPYSYPQKPQGETIRGSEHDVVWQYRTLEKEGKLEGSIIPDWFLREGWLNVYPTEPQVSLLV